MNGAFTIPAEESFLDGLASGLSARYPPERLAETVIYLPTRRACRELTEAFLRQPGDAGLLPTAFPLGDVDVDDLAFTAIEPALSIVETALDLPPAITPERRTLLLAKLAQAKRAAEGERLPLAAAIRLGEALGRFLDELAIEGVDPKAIRAIEVGQYAEHWQAVLAFLEIVLSAWPEVLKEQDRMDPAARREALAFAQAEAWEKVPPDRPIVIAGSTGAAPSTRALMRAALAAPAGAVVLPGFDTAAAAEDAALWRETPTHPQHVMSQTLRDLDLAPDDVRIWFEADDRAPDDRTRLIREALRPAAAVGAWSGLEDSAFDAARADVLRVDAPNDDMEARAIALFLREHAGDGRRAALVTPDRTLARRAAAELRRWNIDADDSAGRPLGETAVGAFLRLVARAFRPGAGAVDLLALMKHPFAAGGMAPARFRRRARALELAVWRNARAPRRTATLDQAATFLESASRKPLAEFAETVHRLATPLLDLDGDGFSELTDLLDAHIHVAEALAATAEDAGADRLWRGEDGEAAADALARALDAADASPRLAASDYADAFDALIERAVVRPRRSDGAPVEILGVLEARLSRFDAVALGGLDEGLWPRQPAADPWFSRGMRREVGLSDPDRRIGLSAHDFSGLATTPKLLLSRSLRRDGAPGKPSRWLARLDAVLAATGAAPLAEGSRSLLDLAERLDPTLPPNPIPPPAPRPPVAVRPRQLSVTSIKTLRDDPYAIYAQYILGLRKLDPLDPPPSPADRGKIVHGAFERFWLDWPDALPPDIFQALLEAGDAAFREFADDPAIEAFWRPAFERAASWAAAAEAARRRELGVARVFAETKGAAEIEAPGGPFTVKARADRIDRLTDGAIAILDIKTGSPPTLKSMKDGKEPQLPLEAAIALHGRFGDLEGRPTRELAVWRLAGRGDKSVALEGDDVDAAATLVWESAARLVAGFDDPATPYLSEPWGPVGWSDYRALARLSEDVEDGN